MQVTFIYCCTICHGAYLWIRKSFFSFNFQPTLCSNVS